MSEIREILSAIDAGGNAALLVAVWFMYKCEARLARIEKVMDVVTKEEFK